MESYINLLFYLKKKIVNTVTVYLVLLSSDACTTQTRHAYTQLTINYTCPLMTKSYVCVIVISHGLVLVTNAVCHSQCTACRPYHYIHLIMKKGISPWPPSLGVLSWCPIFKWRHCNHLTNWGWGEHICVSELTIIGSDNGLSPGWLAIHSKIRNVVHFVLSSMC